MPELILPDHLKPKKKTPDEFFKDQIYTQAYGKYKDDDLHPKKHQHAVTHYIANGWAEVQKADWCPTCNGQLQKDFEEHFAKLQADKQVEDEAKLNDNLKPVLDQAQAQGKLITFPTQKEDS